MNKYNKVKKIKALLYIIHVGCIKFNISVDSPHYKEIIRLVHLCLPINIQGKNKHDLICAIFYIAQSQDNLLVYNYKELLSFFNSRSKSIYRLIEFLKDKGIKGIKGTPSLLPIKKHCIKIIAESFPYIIIKEEQVQFINKIISKLVEKGTIISNPNTICAGLIYLICKHFKIKTNQLEIAAKIGVSDCSLRRWYNILNLLEIEN